ncbi:hypothetical protein [Microbulbifer variabilis]|uniref:hypothetical protein n=1 Tax=Microbulbifer variabilis TaxID=266805 RepID=UPI001CFD51E6|nr:hypothetical protein [Microbulbifer variabilis]
MEILQAGVCDGNLGAVHELTLVHLAWALTAEEIFHGFSQFVDLFFGLIVIFFLGVVESDVVERHPLILATNNLGEPSLALRTLALVSRSLR